MNNWIVFGVYCVFTIICAAFVVGVTYLLHKGMKAFFSEVCGRKEIVAFFVMLAEAALILGGVGAAIGSTYSESAGKNWLTLVWSAAGQVRASIDGLLGLLKIFVVAFLVFFVAGKFLAARKSE
ncbi:MAG: hypothetical protein PHE61_05250 [Candidatus Omnitrophica bacterium]|nr:hypothetical protein [Candidatus Omnitrophota bacterium]